MNVHRTLSDGFRIGDAVEHPHAGLGTVLKIINASTVQVSWDRGGRGVAYARDLMRIDR